MDDHERRAERDLRRLADRLLKEIPPPVDLWPSIEARLSQPSLESLVRELPRDVEPPIDLWPSIEWRLAQRRKHRWAVAAAVMLATLSALLIVVATQDRIDPDDTELAALSTSPETTPAGAGIWWMLQMPPASAEFAETIQRNLGLVRDERRSIEQAIEQDPSDAHLRELWAYAYETELRLENEASRVMLSYQRGYEI